MNVNNLDIEVKSVKDNSVLKKLLMVLCVLILGFLSIRHEYKLDTDNRYKHKFEFYMENDEFEFEGLNVLTSFLLLIGLGALIYKIGKKFPWDTFKFDVFFTFSVSFLVSKVISITFTKGLFEVTLLTSILFISSFIGLIRELNMKHQQKYTRIRRRKSLDIFYEKIKELKISSLKNDFRCINYIDKCIIVDKNTISTINYETPEDYFPKVETNMWNYTLYIILISIKNLENDGTGLVLDVINYQRKTYNGSSIIRIDNFQATFSTEMKIKIVLDFINNPKSYTNNPFENNFEEVKERLESYIIYDQKDNTSNSEQV